MSRTKRCSNHQPPEWSVPFSEVEPRPVEWAWRRHIPAGMLTIIGGQPSRGKSLISFHIAAEVSREGGNVLISNHEDALREISRPRIAAAGADLSKVHYFRPVLNPLPEGMDRLEAEIRRHDAKLVILDPFTSHVACPTGNSAQVRRALGPLQKLCEKTGCAVLIVHHQIKNASGNTDPLATVGGSNAGLVGMARAVYLAGRNPADSDQFVLVNAKPLGPVPPSIAFELDVAGGLEDGDEPEAGYLRLLGECNVGAKQLVESQYRELKDEPKPTKAERAAEWLSRYLWAASGPCKPSEVAADAQRQDPPITVRQLRRASTELGASEGQGRDSTWGLSDELRAMFDEQFGSGSDEADGDDG